HWVLTDKDAPVPSASTKPSFTYVAIDGTTESAPAEVLIETPVLADPVRTGDDQVLTLAGFIDPATGQPHQILTFKKLDIGGLKENNGAADPVGPLDGDITVREPGSSGGDPADLGGFAMQSEDGLGFYLTSLPATGKLYYKAQDQLGDGSGLTEITAANLLNASGSNLATALKLNTNQELYWITTGADLTKQAPVTVGGQNLTLAEWKNPAGGNGLTVDITAFGFDGQEGYIVTQNGAQGVRGSDGTLSGRVTTFQKGGIGVQGEAPNVPFQAPDWEAELGRGYGSYFGTSEKLRFAFSQAIASTTIQVSHLYQPEGEIGVVDLYYQGRFVKSLTFGFYDPLINKLKPDLEVSYGRPKDTNGNDIGATPGTGSYGYFTLDGTVFDTLEFTSLSDGLRFEGNSQFDPSDYYVDGMTVTPVTGVAPTASFNYKVATTEGRLSDVAQVIIDQTTFADSVATTFGSWGTIFDPGFNTGTNPMSFNFTTFFDLGADSGLTGEAARLDIQDALIEQNSAALIAGTSRVVTADIGAYNPATGKSYDVFRLVEAPKYGALNYVYGDASAGDVAPSRLTAVQSASFSIIASGETFPSDNGLLAWHYESVTPVRDLTGAKPFTFFSLVNESSRINPIKSVFSDFDVYGLRETGLRENLAGNLGYFGYNVPTGGWGFTAGQTFVVDVGANVNALDMTIDFVSDSGWVQAPSGSQYALYSTVGEVTLYRGGKVVYQGTFGADPTATVAQFGAEIIPYKVVNGVKVQYTVDELITPDIKIPLYQYDTVNGSKLIETKGPLHIDGIEFDRVEIKTVSDWTGQTIYNRLNSTSSMFDTSASLTPYDVKVIGGQVEFKYQAGLQTGADPFGNPIYRSWTDPATVTSGAPIKNPAVDYDYDGNRVDIALGDAGAVQEGGSLVYD
ncbi:MAG: hypothetical protein ACK5TD_01330, partial [bacterium]